MYTIVATALYILAIAFLFAPKCPTAPETTASIDYFPDPEPVPAQAPPAEDLKSEAPETETALAPELVVSDIPPAPAPMIDLPYSELKAMARRLKIPRYSRLSKAELIGALA